MLLEGSDGVEFRNRWIKKSFLKISWTLNLGHGIIMWAR